MKYKKKTYIIDENASELEKFCYNNATRMTGIGVTCGKRFIYFEFDFSEFELNIPILLDTGTVLDNYMELVLPDCHCCSGRVPLNYTAEQTLEQLKLFFASEGIEIK